MGDTIIAIPSYRRADRLLSTLGTLDYISPKWRGKTVLVVREEEKLDYSAVCARRNVVMTTIPSDRTEGRFFGWGDTMDWIVDTLAPQCERLVIMDDDLKMAYREDLRVGYRSMTPEDFDLFMSRLTLTDMDIPVMSGIARQFSQTKTDEYMDNARVNQLYSLYAPFFVRHPQFRFARPSGMKFMTDYYFCLSLLQAGVRNRVWNRFTRDDVNESKNQTTIGGCSEFRTAAEHSKSALQLRSHFPDLVTCVQKDNWKEPRIGVRISWAKAFKESGSVDPSGSAGEFL